MGGLRRLMIMWVHRVGEVKYLVFLLIERHPLFQAIFIRHFSDTKFSSKAIMPKFSCKGLYKSEAYRLQSNYKNN